MQAVRQNSWHAGLASLDVSLAEVNAVLITHEHIDHIAALDVLSRQCGMKIYANRATGAGHHAQVSKNCTGTLLLF